MIPVIIGIVVVVVIVCAIAGIYNNMVTKRNRIDNAWQNIDTQLQRRNDLIPNLVETVKGYAKHEQDTLAARGQRAQRRRERHHARSQDGSRQRADRRPAPALRRGRRLTPILSGQPTLRSSKPRSKTPRTR